MCQHRRHRLAPPSRKINSACAPQLLSLRTPTTQVREPGLRNEKPVYYKEQTPSPQLEKNPSSDKDPERPKQIKLIKKEKENSPAPTILAPQVCSPSSHQARAGGCSPWVIPCLLLSKHKSSGCAFCTDIISHQQYNHCNFAISAKPSQGTNSPFSAVASVHRRVSLCSQALRKPPSQALPTTVWGLLPSRP